MKKVLFLTNYASPYKVEFFDTLAQYMDVTVLLSERMQQMTHRDASWFVEGNGRAKFVELSQKHLPGGKVICPEIISWLKKDFDRIVIWGYSKPTELLALLYLKVCRIPYVMEVDGGLIRQDGKLAKMVKTWAVRGASLYLSSGKATTDYLVYYGAEAERVRNYPFSSWYERDFPEAIPTLQDKILLRQKLGIAEEKVCLSIGQFIPRKGFDVLMKAAQNLPKTVGIYIVGSEPTEEYLQMQKDYGLFNVHFVGFQKKASLSDYYSASDFFVLPTREDIWGLVINEAMAFGLPVVTTDHCVAGLCLVQDGVNGYIVPAGDSKLLLEAMENVLSGDMETMGRASLNAIDGYTIDNMAKVHAQIL